MLPVAAPPDDDVLSIRSLHYAYGATPALTGVSLGVAEGEILAVTGPRGSGKTTLLRCLSGQLCPQEGEVFFGGGPVHTLTAARRERLRLERFGWIDTEPQLVPELSAWENAALPLLLAGEPHRAAKRQAAEWLERLDVGGLGRRRPRALTRAEQQRVAIARALVGGPDVLFADEPTATLHSTEGVRVLRTLVAAARSHGITAVIAAHDTTTTGLADRTVALVDGSVAQADGSVAQADGSVAQADGRRAGAGRAGSVRPHADATEDPCSLSA